MNETTLKNFTLFTRASLVQDVNAASRFPQIQSEKSLDDQNRPEDSLHWLPVPVCVWSGFHPLHFSPGSISQGVLWSQSSQTLGPEATSARSEIAYNPLQQ